MHRRIFVWGDSQAPRVHPWKFIAAECWRITDMMGVQVDGPWTTLCHARPHARTRAEESRLLTSLGLQHLALRGAIAPLLEASDHTSMQQYLLACSFRQTFLKRMNRSCCQAFCRDHPHSLQVLDLRLVKVESQCRIWCFGHARRLYKRAVMRRVCQASVRLTTLLQPSCRGIQPSRALSEFGV